MDKHEPLICSKLIHYLKYMDNPVTSVFKSHVLINNCALWYVEYTTVALI